MSKPTTKSKPVAIDGKAELVPPVPKKLQAELAALEQKVLNSGVIINRRLTELAYDIVEAGLYLLKIRAIYALSPQEKGAVRKACPSETNSAGFAGWLAARQEYVPRGSAYRYMNAALNVGLTENDTEASVTKLRETKALEGRKLSADDLYKTPRQLPSPDNNDAGTGQLELNLIVKETVAQQSKLSEELKKLRDEMDEPTLQTVAEILQDTLEELTGAEWDIVDAKRGKRKVAGD